MIISVNKGLQQLRILDPEDQLGDNLTETTTQKKVNETTKSKFCEIKEFSKHSECIKLTKSSNMCSVARGIFLAIAAISMLFAMTTSMTLLLISITFFSLLISMAFKSKAESIVTEININKHLYINSLVENQNQKNRNPGPVDGEIKKIRDPKRDYDCCYFKMKYNAELQWYKKIGYCIE